MNIQVFAIGAVLGLLAGYLLAGYAGPEEVASISVPDSAIELTKCMPGMGYHYADPETLPRGPIYMRDGDGEVVGIEYLLMEEELEMGDGPDREFMLSAFREGFTNVSLAYEPEGVGEIPAPLYALHLYKLDEEARAEICEGEELEPDHHEEDEGAEASATGMMVGENAIVVSDQPPGSEVTASLATLENDGYVVVHQTEDGAPGAIIGASGLLPAGENSNVSVPLDAPQAEGTELIAMLHADNGDGQFNAADDAPVMHDESPVMMRFVTDSDAAVPAEVSI